MDYVTLDAGDLLLRPWRDDDIEAVYRACQDPDIQRWTTIPSPYGREDAAWFVSTCPDRWRSGTASFAAVDAESGSLLGSFGLEGVEHEQGPEIGFWVAADARVLGEELKRVQRQSLAAE